MDRRTAIFNLLGRKEDKAYARPSAPLSGLAPYSGPWDFQQAAHLLRRCMFGPAYSQIKWAVEQGLDATLDRLFEDQPLPAPPLNSKFGGDPNVPVGSTWVNAPNPTGYGNILSYRYASLKAWTIGVLWNEGVSIREKLTLFWRNHFPIDGVEDAKFLFRNINLLRRYASGNFRDLVKEITIDPSMLIYLNGNINLAQAPNENYARELLELFTIGKKPQVTPGDYVNYTEQDVREIARALTGWRDYGYGYNNIYTNGEIGAEFRAQHHDTGTKVLSSRFNNAVINNEGPQEYLRVIDIIFQQPEVARFICRKLYMWFVYYEIDDETEANVIEPMAQILLDHDFEIGPALRALLSSEHFLDPEYYGVMIKNPADFLMSALKPLEIEHSQPLEQKYDSWYAFFGYKSQMQMQYYHLPEVAGWRAYYREPLFYRHWISATTLPVRTRVMQQLSNNGISPFVSNGMFMKADVLKIIETIDNPSNPDSVVEEFTRILLPKPLADGQYATLKNILLAGLPDFEWTVEYQTYAQNPANSGLAASIESRLRGLLSAILSMPEFHLM